MAEHPRDWPWCSYGSVVAGGCSERLASFLGDTPREAQTRFLRLVDEAAEIVHAKRQTERRDVLRAAESVVTGWARSELR